MANVGKKFESQFQKSVPKHVLCVRMPDSAQTFGGCKSGIRFTNKSPFDFQLYDPCGILYGLELKTVRGNSISFERTKEEKGEIHFHQIQALKKWDEYGGIVAGFIIEFRKQPLTVFIEIKEFLKLLDYVKDKKSFHLTDLEDSKIDYIIIPQTLLRSNYKYDVSYLLDVMKERKIEWEKLKK